LFRSKAKDEMFAATHTATSPWYVVESNDKKKVRAALVCVSSLVPLATVLPLFSQARLNCISHLLTLIPYGELPYTPVEMPERQKDTGYVRPPKGTNEILVPERY
jgi:hypothetical protein